MNIIATINIVINNVILDMLLLLVVHAQSLARYSRYIRGHKALLDVELTVGVTHIISTLLLLITARVEEADISSNCILGT